MLTREILSFKSKTMKLFITTQIFILLFSFAATAQTKMTERDFDGLKGSVKSVSTERLELTGEENKTIEAKAKLENEITYNKNGDRLTYKSYHQTNGLLFESIIYGFIDGQRISCHEEVKNPNKITKSPEREIKPIRQTVSEFTYKLKYKYDKNGKLIEDSWHANDDELWIRFIYNYKDKQREEFVYSADGSLDQKYITVFDDKGIESEMISYDIKTNEIDGKESYEYSKFDAKGNWTEKTTFEHTGDDWKVKKPYEIRYRKIIYH